jgi:N-acetylmuramoyl-L-alanine amidase
MTRAMSVRTFLFLVLGLPLLLFGAASATGVRIPVPVWGRDYIQRIEVFRGELSVALPDISGPTDPSRPLVVIDAGHGGGDPGSIGGGVREKDVVLAISLRVRDILLEQGGIRVALTREDDRIIPLAERPEIARRLGADLFISIHADSAGSLANVSGATIYTLSSEASSEAAARFAARENNADRLNGIAISNANDTVSAILVELSQDRTQGEATEFARLLEREGQDRIAFHPEPQRRAALAVLRAPDVPGVLFESGFVTNAGDRARLTTEAGRNQYAEVLARTIRVFFARRSDAATGD